MGHVQKPMLQDLQDTCTIVLDSLEIALPAKSQTQIQNNTYLLFLSKSCVAVPSRHFWTTHTLTHAHTHTHKCLFFFTIILHLTLLRQTPGYFNEKPSDFADWPSWRVQPNGETNRWQRVTTGVRCPAFERCEQSSSMRNSNLWLGGKLILDGWMTRVANSPLLLLLLFVVVILPVISVGADTYNSTDFGVPMENSEFFYHRHVLASSCKSNNNPWGVT